jgi:outer membrane receptor protein involved in Fe transport
LERQERLFYGEYSHESTSYYSPFNDATFVGHDGFDIFNARITWQSPAARVNVSVFANNLTDERYINSVLDFQGIGLGTPSMFNDPRAIGAMVSYRY